MTIRTTLSAVLSGLALALLAGCGSSDGFAAPPTPTVNANEVPTGATATLASYVNYLDTLPRTETGEPLSIDSATPPVSDTAEPLAPT